MRRPKHNAPPEDARCPICKHPLINLPRGHLKECLKKHNMVLCPHCSKPIEKNRLQAHIAAEHQPKAAATETPERDDAEMDDGELLWDEDTVRRVPWRILPPGEGGAGGFFRYLNDDDLHPSVERKEDEQRLAAIEELGPDEKYRGLDDFAGYLVYVFKDKQMAILESAEYGNATYIIYGPWQKLSRLTKAKLMSRSIYHRYPVKKIAHTRGWLERIKDLFIEFEMDLPD